jgi:hypothetical protein
MLRFWVGFKKNCKNAADAFGKMLVWRKDNKIDDIRDKIMAGLTPEQFPRSGSTIESPRRRTKSLYVFIPSALPPSRSTRQLKVGGNLHDTHTLHAREWTCATDPGPMRHAHGRTNTRTRARILTVALSQPPTKTRSMHQRLLAFSMTDEPAPAGTTRFVASTLSSRRASTRTSAQSTSHSRA